MVQQGSKLENRVSAVYQEKAYRQLIVISGHAGIPHCMQDPCWLAVISRGSDNIKEGGIPQSTSSPVRFIQLNYACSGLMSDTIDISTSCLHTCRIQTRYAFAFTPFLFYEVLRLTFPHRDKPSNVLDPNINFAVDSTRISKFPFWLSA